MAAKKKREPQHWAVIHRVECSIMVRMPASSAKIAADRVHQVLQTYLGIPGKVKVSGIQKRQEFYYEVSDVTLTLEDEPEKE
jgi:hypothetical protein